MERLWRRKGCFYIGFLGHLESVGGEGKGATMEENEKWGVSKI